MLCFKRIMILTFIFLVTFTGNIKGSVTIDLFTEDNFNNPVADEVFLKKWTADKGTVTVLEK